MPNINLDEFTIKNENEIPPLKNEKGEIWQEKIATRHLVRMTLRELEGNKLIIKVVYHATSIGRWERREIREVPESVFPDGTKGPNIKDILLNWRRFSAYSLTAAKDVIHRDQYSAVKQMARFVCSTPYKKV